MVLRLWTWGVVKPLGHGGHRRLWTLPWKKWKQFSREGGSDSFLFLLLGLKCYHRLHPLHFHQDHLPTILLLTLMLIRTCISLFVLSIFKNVSKIDLFHKLSDNTSHSLRVSFSQTTPGSHPPNIVGFSNTNASRGHLKGRD